MEHSQDGGIGGFVEFSFPFHVVYHSPQVIFYDVPTTFVESCSGSIWLEDFV